MNILGKDGQLKAGVIMEHLGNRLRCLRNLYAELAVLREHSEDIKVELWNATPKEFRQWVSEHRIIPDIVESGMKVVRIRQGRANRKSLKKLAKAWKPVVSLEIRISDRSKEVVFRAVRS